MILESLCTAVSMVTADIRLCLETKNISEMNNFVIWAIRYGDPVSLDLSQEVAYNYEFKANRTSKRSSFKLLLNFCVTTITEKPSI